MKKILMMIAMLVLTVVSIFAEPVKQDVEDVNAFATTLLTEYCYGLQFYVCGPRSDDRIVYTFKGEKVYYDGEKNVVLTEKGLGSYDIIVVFKNGGVFQVKNMSKKNAEKLLGNIKEN